MLRTAARHFDGHPVEHGLESGTTMPSGKCRPSRLAEDALVDPDRRVARGRRAASDAPSGNSSRRTTARKLREPAASSRSKGLARQAAPPAVPEAFDDLGEGLLPVAQDEGVEDLGQGLGVEGGRTAGDDQGAALAPVCERSGMPPRSRTVRMFVSLSS